MKYFSVLLFCITMLMSNNGVSQYSLGGGLSTFGSFETDFTRYGIHAFYEAPRNEVNSFFIRGTLTLPINFYDSINVEGDINNPPNPFVKTVELRRRTSLFSVDGGTRVYLFNTYDAGFSVYGGFHLRGFLSTYSERLGEYDEDLYSPSQGALPSSTSLLLGIGGNVGFKHQLPMNGALTFDLVVDLIRRLHDPAAILTNEIAPLSFSFNVGYRFDWY